MKKSELVEGIGEMGEQFLFDFMEQLSEFVVDKSEPISFPHLNDWKVTP